MSEVQIYTVDEEVFCKAFGSWYPGKVVKLGRTKVHVEYTTGTGVTRVKPCTPGTQVLKEKPEGDGRGRRRREPEMVERKLTLNLMERMRLLSAFQAIGLPKGMNFRGVTRTRAREVIEEMTGIRLKRSAKPPRASSIRGIEDYLAWASQPDVQKPTDAPSPSPHEASIH